MPNFGDFDSYKYVEELVASHPTIREVWLYGSRANNSARGDSDWDILVLANEEVFQILLIDVRFNHSKVDLVVAPSFSGDYQKPWGVRNKRGNFENWQWRRISPTQAIYKIGKETPSGDIEEFTLKAICLYPR